MKRALIIQHMDHDHAGRFLDFFAEDGIHPQTVRVFENESIPKLDSFDLLFVLGGAQDTWQEDQYPYLADEKLVIKEWVNQKAKPFLGVCLGHQLLAEALGGKVEKAAASEVGLNHVDLTNAGQAHAFLRGVKVRQPVMQWHFAEVIQVPENAEVLAKSDTSAVQAMAIGNHALSTQFHCEFTPQTVAGWASLPKYMAALSMEHGEGAYDRLTRECLPHMPDMARQTKQMWDNFAKLNGLKP
jgi:GMP synthase-like glutamine amidotransferase